MNTTHGTARSAAVLLVALVSWAIAAPLAFAAAARPLTGTPMTRIPQMRWYRWHPTARQLHKHYGSKVMMGVASTQAFKSLRVEYGFDRGTAHEIPALRAVLVKVSDAQLHTLLTRGTRDPRIRYVSPMHRKRQVTSVPNDPYVSNVDSRTGLAYQWPFWTTHLDRALDLSQGDSHVVVGVLDTGIEYVRDLTGKIDSVWTVAGADVRQVYTSNDTIGHGTAVASEIAANVNDGFGMVGFGGDSHVIAVNASDDIWFFDAKVAVALDKLVSLGARIVNMSLGGTTPSEPILVDAIHRAAASGVLLVASAGNDAHNRVTWPAADLQPAGGGRSYGIAVGATDVDGRRATFSDWGDHLSMVAPGTYGGTYGGVVVALPTASWFDDRNSVIWTDDDARYGYLAGTSFAAPLVTGVAALIWAARPNLTNYDVADILKQSARRTATDWTAGMGCGVLDAGAALELATSRPASAWAETPNSTNATCTAFGKAPAAWPTEKSQMIEFKPLANKHLGDKDFKVKASTSSGLPVSLIAEGSCTVEGDKVHLVRTGQCSITASRAGNAEYYVAPSVTQAFFVAKKVHLTRHRV
jgi:subtilisin family serine protease